MTYFFTRGSREDELGKAKADMELADKRIAGLEQSLRDSYHQNTLLLKGVVDKSSLESSVKLALEQCERHRSMIRYAFQNSTCIFRQQYPDDAVSRCKVNEPVTTEMPKPN